VPNDEFTRQNFPEMSKELKDKVYLELVDWRHQTWRSWPLIFDEPNYISPDIIILNSNLLNLASNLHKASSCERFDLLIQSWDSIEPLSSNELASLWEEVQALNDRFGKEMEELTRVKKLKQSQVKKGKEVAGNVEGMGDGDVDDGCNEINVALMMVESQERCDTVEGP